MVTTMYNSALSSFKCSHILISYIFFILTYAVEQVTHYTLIHKSLFGKKISTNYCMQGDLCEFQVNRMKKMLNVYHRYLVPRFNVSFKRQHLLEMLEGIVTEQRWIEPAISEFSDLCVTTGQRTHSTMYTLTTPDLYRCLVFFFQIRHAQRC